MKSKLAQTLSTSKKNGKLSEVWIRMMLDYYENKKQIEQTYGELQAARISSEDASNLNNVEVQASVGMLEELAKSDITTDQQEESGLAGPPEEHQIELTVDDVEEDEGAADLPKFEVATQAA